MSITTMYRSIFGYLWSIILDGFDLHLPTPLRLMSGSYLMYDPSFTPTLLLITLGYLVFASLGMASLLIISVYIP
jgi:hypothetical protein